MFKNLTHLFPTRSNILHLTNPKLQFYFFYIKAIIVFYLASRKHKKNLFYLHLYLSNCLLIKDNFVY